MKTSFANSAIRQLSKLDKATQEKIVNKIEFYLAQKNPLYFAEKLTNQRFGQWRFRIGTHRMLFDKAGDELIILKIGHRKDIYK